MAKKIVKKKKLKLANFFLVILVLGIIASIIFFLLNTKIKNITITGANYLNDDYILSLAEIKDYPSFYFTSSSKIKRKIEKSDYIEKVTVQKKFYNSIFIKVKENKPLFINEVNQTVVFDNGVEVKLDKEIDLFRVPSLMNYVPDTKYKTLIKNVSNINQDILGKVSEITYVPNDYDKDRFLLYMDDENSVYLTLTKFKMLNYYNKVLSQLSGRKGILYLDSGNHFQIKE